MNHRPNVSWCCAPFCEADSLVPAPSPRRVPVRLDVAGVHHEPLQVRFVDTSLQETFPHAGVSPSDETPVGIAPITVFRRQIPPWRTGTDNPEDRVDESPVVFGDSAPSAPSAGKEGLDLCPHCIGKVMAVESICCFGFYDAETSRFDPPGKHDLVTTRSRIEPMFFSEIDVSIK